MTGPRRICQFRRRAGRNSAATKDARRNIFPDLPLVASRNKGYLPTYPLLGCGLNFGEGHGQNFGERYLSVIEIKSAPHRWSVPSAHASETVAVPDRHVLMPPRRPGVAQWRRGRCNNLDRLAVID